MKSALFDTLWTVGAIIAWFGALAAAIMIGWAGWTAPDRYPDQMLFAALVVMGALFCLYWLALVLMAIPWTLGSDAVEWIRRRSAKRVES